MSNRTNKDKLENLLKKAKEDLEVWLFYAEVKTEKEFFEKELEIKNKSFHKHDDVIRQLKYISKLEEKIKGLK